MPMPKNCYYCNFQDVCGTCSVDKYHRDVNPCFNDNRPDWCPLCQVDKLCVADIIPNSDAEKYPGIDFDKITLDHLKKKMSDFIYTPDYMSISNMSYYDEYSPDIYKATRATMYVIKNKEREMSAE